MQAFETSVLDSRLKLLLAQRVLFQPQPIRVELLAAELPEPTTPVHVRVHRNHAFEQCATVIPNWMCLRGWSPQFHLSDYDDSLCFQFKGDADVELIWLDFFRYKQMSMAAFATWLRDRIGYLREYSTSPILFVNWAENADLAAAVQQTFDHMPVSGTLVVNMATVTNRLGDRWLDERAAKFSGSRLSDRASMLLARELACHWLPAVIAPRLKALVVDLDNTVYSGVLGEDGADGVQLTDGHRQLQSYLLELRNSGIFLALASRNEPVDVEELFRRRADFPLRWEHFSSRRVNWQPKSQAVQEIANELRIGTDAMLFLDDNIGELAQVGAALPELHLLHAESDPAATLRAVNYFPGLWSPGVTTADRLRIQDLESARERHTLLQAASSPAEYFRSLQVELILALRPLSQAQRILELSCKTNQFNLALQRFNAAEIVRRLNDPNSPIVTIQMRDRLSDSGIVGALFCQISPDTLIVDELVISCRALGRNLEDLMIAEALKLACPILGDRRMIFHATQGLRNGPARSWLQRAAGRQLQPGSQTIEVSPTFRQSRPEFSAVRVRVNI